MHISFIHSGHFYSAPSSLLLLRGAPAYSTYCIGVSRRSAQACQATAGKGLAQGPYLAARAGVKPTTLRLKFIVSTKAPPRPTTISDIRTILSTLLFSVIRKTFSKV